MSLALEGVAVARGGRPVVAGVTLTLAPGEAVRFKGANGAGKTSLLRAIAGLLPLAAGRIALDGSEAREPARRARAVHCGHADGVKAAMSVRENLGFWATLYGAPKTRVEDALAAFGLARLRETRAADLSAGQRRRLGLCRLIIAAKPIWLLDEPTASMDAAASARLIGLIAAHRQEGGSVLIATHDRLDLPNARAFVLEAAGPGAA
ncbi:MAG: heme ABC exporter ATP-binding protein CcmA [Amphiplicatus sp.]